MARHPEDDPALYLVPGIARAWQCIVRIFTIELGKVIGKPGAGSLQTVAGGREGGIVCRRGAGGHRGRAAGLVCRHGGGCKGVGDQLCCIDAVALQEATQSVGRQLQATATKLSGQQEPRLLNYVAVMVVGMVTRGRRDLTALGWSAGGAQPAGSMSLPLKTNEQNKQSRSM